MAFDPELDIVLVKVGTIKVSDTARIIVDIRVYDPDGGKDAAPKLSVIREVTRKKGTDDESTHFRAIGRMTEDEARDYVEILTKVPGAFKKARKILKERTKSKTTKAGKKTRAGTKKKSKTSVKRKSKKS